MASEAAELYEAIQGVMVEQEDGALLTGFFLIAEMSRPDGSKFLAYRTGDLNREHLNSWTGLGFLHSAVQAVEQQTWDCTEDPEDGEDGEANGD